MRTIYGSFNCCNIRRLPLYFECFGSLSIWILLIWFNIFKNGWQNFSHINIFSKNFSVLKFLLSLITNKIYFQISTATVHLAIIVERIRIWIVMDFYLIDILILKVIWKGHYIWKLICLFGHDRVKSYRVLIDIVVILSILCLLNKRKIFKLWIKTNNITILLFIKFALSAKINITI